MKFPFLKDTPSAEPNPRPENSVAQRASEREQAHAELERLAQAKIPEVREGEAERAEAFRLEYERDVAGYAFKCRRVGDFMTLEIQRSANPKPVAGRWLGCTDRELVTTVNLSLVTEIKLVAGHAPDTNDEIGFGYSIRYDNGSTLGGTGFGHYMPQTGQQFDVVPNSQYASGGRTMWAADPAPIVQNNQNPYQNMAAYIYDDSYKIQARATDCARPAKDDCIQIMGLGKLFAPAGFGQGVLDAILAEIKRGAKAK